MQLSQIVLKKYNAYKNITSIFLFLAFLFLIIGLSNKESNITTQSGWVLQTDLQSQLRGRTISDMTFTDSVTGYAVTIKSTSNDTGFIFKTTNGGDNWFVNYFTTNYYFMKIRFVGDSIGYAIGGTGGGYSCVYKTINKGSSWFSLNLSSASLLKSISILNKDTVYVCDDDGLVGGVFRTTNGGQNWQRTWFVGIYNPLEIYMYNARIGFYAQGDLWKTTDGGFNWTIINNKGFVDIKFFDSLTGYKVYADSLEGGIQKTTNGGYNWNIQLTPNIPGVTSLKGIIKLWCINRDTMWAIGNYIWYPNPYRYYGIICKTANGGLNWGYQIPDTHSVQISRYDLISFVGNKYGWLYNGNYNGGKGMGIHTTIGGDTTFYTNIKEQKTNNASDYILRQNYPNPFNPTTKISYKVKSYKVIKLSVYDVAGKEVTTMVNQKQKAGEYEITFNGSGLPSGVYFYVLYADGVRMDAKKMVMIK